LWLRRDALEQGGGKPRFADAGFTGEAPLACAVFARDHRRSSSSFFLRGRPDRSPLACSASKRLATELTRSAARQRSSQSLGPAAGPDFLEFEQIAEKPSGARR
jgi:hypothetical protein